MSLSQHLAVWLWNNGQATTSTAQDSSKREKKNSCGFEFPSVDFLSCCNCRARTTRLCSQRVDSSIWFHKHIPMLTFAFTIIFTHLRICAISSNGLLTCLYFSNERRDQLYCTMRREKKDRDKDSLAALEASYQQRHVRWMYLS